MREDIAIERVHERVSNPSQRIKAYKLSPCLRQGIFRLYSMLHLRNECFESRTRLTSMICSMVVSLLSLVGLVVHTSTKRSADDD